MQTNAAQFVWNNETINQWEEAHDYERKNLYSTWGQTMELNAMKDMEHQTHRFQN